MNVPDLSGLTSGKLIKRNAFAPLVQFSIVTVLAEVFLVWAKAPQWLIDYLGYFLLAVVSIALLVYIYLLIFDRDRLQSESFQVEKLQLILQHSFGRDLPATVIDHEPATSNTHIEASGTKAIGDDTP